MVRLVQLLCPDRHCILAAAYEEGRSTFQECRANLEAARRDLKIRPWCGLCGSHVLNYEEGQTPFETLKEAAPLIQALMIGNLLTRAAADRRGTSFDARRRN